MPEGFVISWTAVLIVAGIGVAAILGMFMTSRMLAPRRPSAMKDIPYECGIEPAPFRWSQIQIRYYVSAILFLIFDVEAVFLFPWAIIYTRLGLFGLIEMLVFLLILGVGLMYVWIRGGLDWE